MLDALEQKSDTSITDYRRTIEELKDTVTRNRNKHINEVSISPPHNPDVPIADQIVKAINSPESGSMWTPEHYRVRIITIDETQRGIRRGESSHNVGFSEAVLHNTESQKQESFTVVYKPYGDPSRAIKEMINHQLVRKRGFDTVLPLCALAIGKVNGYFISLFRSDLQTLDLEKWPQYQNKNINTTTFDRLTRIAHLMADWHTNGISHQDTQIRNFSIIPTGEVIGFDWESAKIYSTEHVKDTTIYKYSLHDLKYLFSSLTRARKEHGVEFLTDLTETARWQAFKRLVVTPYIERWTQKIESSSSILDNDSDTCMQILSDVEYDLHQFVMEYSPTLH